MDLIKPSTQINSLAFFASEPHTCSYLADHTAVSLFADPSVDITMRTYSRLADYGFRRSGSFVYAPNCPGCDACQPYRVLVDNFSPNRSQRRILKQNADISVKCLPASYSQEHYELYRRYLSSRHAGSTMENPSIDDYMNFLCSNWSETYFYEFRVNNSLLAVSVADKLTQGLSAVYTFFEPEQLTRSLGNYAILWLIQETRALQLRNLYLGYWINDCRKMQYKSLYQPAEVFRHGRWVRYVKTV